jgi:transcriptional regulator GlxA family with amidase domain
MNMRIDILVFPGFDELDAIGPFEVFQNAANCGAGFEVRLVSPSAPGEIIGAHGLRVIAAAAMRDGLRPDLVVVPGGGWIDRGVPGARDEAASGKIPSWLTELYEAGTTIAAVCTGAMLVAEAGLLHGRMAITHHAAIEDLRSAGANVIEARVVDDGQIVTAGGVTSGLDLAFWLVGRFGSESIARTVESQMEYQRRGDVWRRPKSSA